MGNVWRRVCPSCLAQCQAFKKQWVSLWLLIYIQRAQSPQAYWEEITKRTNHRISPFERSWFCKPGLVFWDPLVCPFHPEDWRRPPSWVTALGWLLWAVFPQHCWQPHAQAHPVFSCDKLPDHRREAWLGQTLDRRAACPSALLLPSLELWATH